MALVVVLLLVPAFWSIGRALAVPGTDSVAARLAEWARGHGLAAVVTWAEKATYKPPKVGGVPSANSPLGSHGLGLGPTGAAVGAPASTLPAAIVPLASPALPHEGQWTVLARVHGQPAMAAAFVRPDAVHTSYVSGIVWFDPRLVRAELHPGTEQPGGSGWSQPSSLAPNRRTGLLAAFNSGFRITESRGGYYEDGRYAAPLRAGIASMVFGRDGTLTVGQWGRDVRLTPGVAAVRQNLALLLDGGRIVPGVADNAHLAWGATLGNALYVWRSGIGVTSAGDIVYAAGNRLSASTLAELLRRAGCMRAMELDINPEWTSFVRYLPAPGSGAPQPVNLLPDMQQPAYRYDTTSSRDFVALYAR